MSGMITAMLLQTTTPVPGVPIPQTFGEGFLIFVLVLGGAAGWRFVLSVLKREQDTSDALRAENKANVAVIAELTTAVKELKTVITTGRPS